MTIAPQELLEARILIVDDQPANVTLLEDLLNSEGYRQVISTTDPTMVSALHRQAPFDLILLDLHMPDVDGFEVMESLRASTAADGVPVLVITAEPDHKLRALQAGAKDFVSKPLDLVEVKTRIRNLIEMRLLHKRLAKHNQYLEQLVLERTAELRASEARYRALTELSTDWYWEQDGDGHFTQVSGPVLEILGLQKASPGVSAGQEPDEGWNEAERQLLRERIASRSPFLDLLLSRTLPDGNARHYRVSGTPMFDSRCTLTGYRGFGVEILMLPAR